MTADDSKIGIFLMAHGAPDSVDHIPEYIRNIRGGKDPSPKIVESISNHYRQIGGSSPLTLISTAQAKALEELLNSDGSDHFRVYLGMRNWDPFMRDVVKQAYEDGVERLIGICLAPQYSRFSTELYLKAFREAIRANDGDVDKADFVYSWADNDYLAEAFADRYKEAAKKIIASGETGFYTVFTVHSIPASSLDEGDPYPEEFTRTIKSITKHVKPIQWNQCYQSAGYIPVPWLEPSVEMTLDKISRFGKKAVLIVPVGFLCDHVEILYDIDIEYKKYAESKDLKLFRTESLNTSPKLIQALASVVWSKLY
jgi:ferrochelatase